MLIVIIVIASIIGLFFAAAIVSLAGFIYGNVKNNDNLKSKCLKILIPTAIVWFLLVVLNSSLIIIYLYNNGGETLDFLLQIIERVKK